MMDFIMVPAVMTIITLGVYKLFELFVCKKERIMLIEKMDERGLLPQMDTPKLRGSSFSFSALKIGCLLGYCWVILSAMRRFPITLLRTETGCIGRLFPLFMGLVCWVLVESD